MVAYATAADINLLPVGRTATLWGALDTPGQDQYLDEASAIIDLYTGQLGGLYTGSRTVDRAIYRDMNTLFLPNTPVTAVTALHITAPPGGEDADPPCIAGDTIRLSGGQSFIYRPPNDGTTLRFLDPYTPFQAGSVVTVTYTAGFVPDTTPELGGLPRYMPQVMRLLIGEMLAQSVDNPSGATALSQGGAHIMFFRGVNASIDRAADLLSALKVEGLG